MSTALHTPLCDLLGVRTPIIQTAMGWVATPELVAAACNAGAFGFLATATLPPSEVDASIARIKELTDRPFGVNFLMEQPGAAEVVDAIVRHGVRAAGYSRSPNKGFIQRFKENGVLCIPTVGAVRHAEKAVQLQGLMPGVEEALSLAKLSPSLLELSGSSIRSPPQLSSPRSSRTCWPAGT